jgi:hypothetical protein
MSQRHAHSVPRLRQETKLLNNIRLKHSHGTTRLFRNTVGAGYVGQAFFMQDGSVVIPRPARVTFGLGPGTSDLIGWCEHVITPEDVGARVAQFVAIECKSKSGRANKQQKAFLELAWDHGALAGIARSLEDVEQILNGEKP